MPEEIVTRFKTRLEDVLPLDDFCLLAFFRDGAIKKCSMKKHLENTTELHVLLEHPEYFQHVMMQTGGHGVSWDVNRTVADTTLYRIGKTIPLTASDFSSFVSHRVVNVAEAAEILGCSRQNVKDLTMRGKLHPIK